LRSFFPQIFVLPLNRSADRVVDDIEDFIHIPHHHTNDTVLPPKEPKHPHQRPPAKLPPARLLPPLGESASGLGRDRKRRVAKKTNGILEVPLEEIGEGKLGKHPMETLIIVSVSLLYSFPNAGLVR
jgi:hypothetical protein